MLSRQRKVGVVKRALKPDSNIYFDVVKVSHAPGVGPRRREDFVWEVAFCLIAAPEELFRCFACRCEAVRVAARTILVEG